MELNNKLLKICICALIVFSAIKTEANANQYKLNETNIETAFSNSQDVTNQFELYLTNSSALNISSAAEDGEKTYQNAAILAFAEVIVPYVVYMGWYFVTAITGGLGVILLPAAVIIAGLASNPWHRFYLGTDDNNFRVGAVYCLTFNGCGSLSTVDGIFLLLKEHDSYYNNPKIIMWYDEL